MWRANDRPHLTPEQGPSPLRIAESHGKIARTRSEIAHAHHKIARTRPEIAHAHHKIARTRSEIAHAHHKIAHTRPEIAHTHHKIAPPLSYSYDTSIVDHIQLLISKLKNSG